MHIIITDAWMAKQQAIHLTGAKLIWAGLAAAVVILFTALGLYHWVFLKGARDGWPVIGSLVKLVVKDEFAQRDRFMRENLDALAKRVGEMQARMVQIESLAERVGGLAGVPAADMKANASSAPARGGALVGERNLSLEEVLKTLDDLEGLTGQRVDLLTVLESRLYDQRLKNLMLPTQEPVAGVSAGSPFGWRSDPFSGRSALHTGLDFQAEPGTPILAAAGGLVVAQEAHAAYGNMVEVDHGNDLITRYAHASATFVKKGDLVKRGQKIAAVGSTGRSTGPHLHFEVLVKGVPQDPQKFLDAGARATASQVASKPLAVPGVLVPAPAQKR